MVQGDKVLNVQGVHKRYAHTDSAKRRRFIQQFSKAIFGRADDGVSLAKDEFWALRDISFTLNRGDALGLIGLNGAGKSTLLSIIARLLLPDQGMVTSRGRIAAMVNLTAGFEVSLTGRDNIFLKGALLGRSRKQMLDQFDEIVAFAEIDDFIDSPVATYSSGMRMRLAFSVSIHTEPDLLLIDEVLSVGDFHFRQKCLRKLNEFRDHASFIFVSHSFQDIARFCDRLIVLDEGRLVFDGSTQEGILFYVESKTPVMQSGRAFEGSLPPELAGAPTALMGDFVHQTEIIESVSFAWSSGNGDALSMVTQGHEIVAELNFRLKEGPDGLVIGIPIWNVDGVLITSVNSDTSGYTVQESPEGWVRLWVQFDSVDFNPGTYFPVVTIVRNSEILFRNPVAPLRVVGSYAMTWGFFTPQVTWSSMQRRDDGND